ncbi:MAG: ABC transporter ATP-binding protein [gamma proteobacterium symbiont of Bathyaustriella thionipta]|nr:ABC transporter ATP-binding protein [gamma proteobacterium symbiont of Bathyaustriella thionipta]MCU7957227.1 ABC transporter ATP-binding protein [gamma proteobacterium symbiont of Bathyaustriella thionipta]MCU7966663.1 ABC transporter ATP-binding protein [gamma proteobacterium symbiont of Bathyaustriella thionipta]
MNKSIAVKIQNVSKVYKLYDKPIDRVKESLNPFKNKYHKDFYALKNINLEIKKGEVLGIVGINGAGKSTLLKIITGVITPTTGRVNINGRVNAILELGTDLKSEMTGRQNIKLSLQINGIDKGREKITNHIIDFADIGEHIDQPVKTYSSGMKARLGFGIATSTDPDVLIVDEVLAVGDVLFQRKCYSRIEKLFKDGKTVIFVSHSAQSVIEFCSRAVLLYDREMILDDKPKRVTDFYQKLVFSKVHNQILHEIKGNLDIVKVEKVFCKDFLKSKDCYIDNLNIEPSILNHIGLSLKNILIFDENNYVVNKLKTNKKYKLFVHAKVSKKYNNLTFGIAIKNVKGLPLSCTRENIEKQGLYKDNEVEFFWHFKCNFLGGKYFIKIDFQEEASNLLYEASDILIFDVEQEFSQLHAKGCIVDLEQECMGL